MSDTDIGSEYLSAICQKGDAVGMGMYCVCTISSDRDILYIKGLANSRAPLSSTENWAKPLFWPSRGQKVSMICSVENLFTPGLISSS
jgi:hypothetical protein